MVFWTEFLDGWWSWEPLRGSCVRCGWGTICTVHMTHSAALNTTTHPKTRCRKPYAATQHLMLLMMGVCNWNMSSQEYINRITLLHQAGIPHYFMRKMHGLTILKLKETRQTFEEKHSHPVGSMAMWSKQIQQYVHGATKIASALTMRWQYCW